jgi:L-iditol 2-dehydrogenase
VVWVGIPPGDTVPLSIHGARRKELTVLMARRFLATYPRAVELIGSGRVDVASLVTHRFGLAGTEAAFTLVDTYGDGVIKALIEPQR